MITLYQLLNIMSLDCELAVYDEDTNELLLCGERSTINPDIALYDTKVVHVLPGIQTKIWIKRGSKTHGI